MKIIVAGAGEVGAHLAKLLVYGSHDITMIDIDEERLKYISLHYDLLTVQGSATSIEVLKEADVKRTDLFIAITAIEEVNITAAILGKKLGAKKTIARIDNKEYLQADNENYFISLGIDSMVYPEILASSEVIDMLKQSRLTKTFKFTEGRLSLFTIKLEKNAPIINRTLVQATNDNLSFDFRAVAITRNNETIIPRGSDRFEADDLVYVVTVKSGEKDLLEYTGKKQIDIKNIMLLGGSRIGMKTAKALESDFNLKIIEKSKQKCEELADFLSKTLVINADGTDLDLLRDEGIERMDVFIAVTGNSETNILSCLIAKKLGVKKTIAEIENIEYVDLAKNMDIDTIINKKTIAASHIFAFTMNAEVSSVRCLNETDAEALEFVAHENSPITKGPLKDIQFPKNAIIGGVIRGSESFIAKGETEILPDDKVVVFALPEAINSIETFFK